MQYRLNHILDTLKQDSVSAGQPKGPTELDWLNQSYIQPPDFFKDLMEEVQATWNLKLKSIAFTHYDFYYDIFNKQGKADDIAYIYYDVNGNRQALTYKALKNLADQKANQWSAKGVTAGATILLVHPTGPDLCVKVIAALKLGLTISLGSPSRPWLLKKQIEALEPDFISTARAYTALVADNKDRLLEAMPQTSKAQNDTQRPQVYHTGQIAARLFDFSLPTPLEPVEISCDELYLNGLRDGIIALNLQPGRVISLPGWPGNRTQPFLILSILLTHATFLDVKPKQIENAPKMFAQDPPDVIGINRQLRNFLWENPEEFPSSCKFWFRHQGTDLDLDKWQAFIMEKGLEKTYTGVLKYHAQAGGLIAFSRHRKGITGAHVMPSAGMNWHIAPLPDTAMMPSEEFGALAFTANGLERTTPYLFIKSGVEWICPKSYLNQKQDRYYPVELVETFLSEHKICRHFLIIPTPRVAAENISHDLVVFIGSKVGTDHAKMKDMIQKTIIDNLGKEYCPDYVAFLPIIPRVLPDGTLDREWCKKEHIANRLSHKAGNTLFKQVSRLKEMMLIQNKVKISEI